MTLCLVQVGMAIELMRREGYDQLPVVDDGSVILGVVTLGSLMARMVKGQITNEATVQSTLYSQFQRITMDTTLGKLSHILHRDHFALIVHTNRVCELCYCAHQQSL